MLYRFCKGIAWIVINLLFKPSIKGTENIPSEGSLVICANHISWWDPLLLACIVPRPIHFMAKSELFENKFVAFLFSKLNAFPVNRGKPDLGAVRKGLTILKEGHVMGIFPEGTRQTTPDQLGPGHGGAALFALRAKAPMLPVAIRGEYKPSGKIRIVCGSPKMVTPSTGKFSTDLQTASLEVMESIKLLWETLEPEKKA